MSQLTLRRAFEFEGEFEGKSEKSNLKRLLSGNRVWLTGASAEVTLVSQDGKGRIAHKLGCSISWV